MTDHHGCFRTPPKILDNGVRFFSETPETEDYWLSEEKFLPADFSILDFLSDASYGLGLEIGAGDGRCTEAVASVTEKLFAQECSATGVERLLQRKLENVVPVLSYGFDLPFHSELFDVVVSITVIEHIPPEESLRFLKEHYRVLKPGGILVIRNDAWLYRVLERIGYYDKKPDPTHVNMITPRKLRRQLEGVGFEVINAAYFPYHRFTKLRLPMMDVLATKGNFVCRRPNGVKFPCKVNDGV